MYSEKLEKLIDLALADGERYPGICRKSGQRTAHRIYAGFRI
jgi:hypothetical protein